MAQKRTKKLNNANLDKLVKQNFPKRKITVQVEGDEYELEIHEVFKPGLVESSIKYIWDVQNEAAENGKNIDVSILGMLAVLKFFTDIDFNGKIVDELNKFVDMSNLGIVQQIIEQFDQKELDKIGQTTMDMTKQLPKAFDMLNKVLLENGSLEGIDIDGLPGTTVKKD